MSSNIPVINANPTKEFFVAVLVRDISLEDAIAELIDNSIDGAKKLATDDNFSMFWVNLKYDKTNFLIEDNCGGIPVEIAKDYAFRFGRSQETPQNYSPELPIGQFGVGMKRSLFRIGNYFTIESTSKTSSFGMDVDVNRWKSKPRWEFEFNKKYEINEQNSIEICKTNIVVTSLHNNVSDDFGSNSFALKLKSKIESVHSEVLKKGIKITINGVILNGHYDELLKSDKIKPFYEKVKIPNAKIEAKIFAGISEPSNQNYGWYIYCNGRQVLRADRTKLTGWDSKIEESIELDESNGSITTPKPHNQFARFRGYVYFESKDASLLPWNTSKSGINDNSEAYQYVRLQMIKALRQVINFLNQLDAEKDYEQKPLENLVNSANSANVTQLTKTASNFTVKPPQNTNTKLQKILYRKTTHEVEKVKRLLTQFGKPAKTNEDVGKSTFDYFLESEDA
jgi:Histidine kinase-, DNA gyrase B-, and HSP90-like ATPase